MSFRLWIGLWIGFILIILVAVDASALVCYITRFTEENFATLIAFIFIYKVSPAPGHLERFCRDKVIFNV
jgi:HCO3- transporter family.